MLLQLQIKNVMQILSFGCLDVFEGQVWEGTDLKV